MKKFRFPLRSVQTVRSIRELRARELFSLAVAELASAVSRAELARLNLTDLQRVVTIERSGTFRPAQQVSYLNAVQAAIRRVEEAELSVRKAQALMDERREAWILTRKDVRVIENLEAKAKDLHLREYEREQQAALDDRTNALVGRAPLMMP